MPPALVVENLTKQYGDLKALDNVSLTVDHGECVALLGPNGAGKSTLLECLTTLKQPTNGTLRVAGANVAKSPGQARRALGVAFQEPVASKHLTAREVIEHHARLYGLDPTTTGARADKLLAFVGLADRAGDRVDTFSGGMRRRLDLARVLVTEPDVLVLDEPTTGLDPRARSEIQDRLRRLIQDGTTILMATHDLDEAQRLASRVAILDEGRLLADERPSRLAHQLGHRVVRVELPETGDPAAVRDVLASREELTVLEAGDAIEWMLPDQGGPSAGEVVDALEAAGLDYDRVTVRDPDLGDVFLQLTGRALDQAPDAGKDHREAIA